MIKTKVEGWQVCGSSELGVFLAACIGGGPGTIEKKNLTCISEEPERAGRPEGPILRVEVNDNIYLYAKISR